MEHHHISVQLKQLLKRGYSINDAQNLLTAPREVIEQATRDCIADKYVAQRTLLSQHHQARYAMGLRG
ncbi:hypothetical protein [Marinobacter sp.]|uniref:hypothetical protein n=1 Tax=Marinobacter sp. TaxID=50741 RepID=UPI001B6225A6|nr:hypothetical protein [Marinobacter sp.]MBQ0832858.1 hypothetical protein [Marinobacter sp.]